MGAYFDESRMFDLMSSARASALNRDVPILCVLGVRRTMSDLTVRLLQETINGMSGCAFLDLSAIPDDQASNVLVRRTLMEYFEPPMAHRGQPIPPRPFA
jgi:hypothetical protein